jgi:hypothetical protein
VTDHKKQNGSESSAETPLNVAGSIWEKTCKIQYPNKTRRGKNDGGRDRSAVSERKVLEKKSHILLLFVCVHSVLIVIGGQSPSRQTH